MCRSLNGRDDKIRTCDLTHPKGALYQAEPRPDNAFLRALPMLAAQGFLTVRTGSIVHGQRFLLTPFVAYSGPYLLRKWNW